MPGYFYAFAMCCQPAEASSQRNVSTIFALNLTARAAGAFVVLSQMYTLHIERMCLYVCVFLSNAHMEITRV